MASEQTCVGKLGHSGLRVPWSPHLRVDNAMLLVPRPCSARFLLQKMNESWMCEEEPEALERSSSAKVGCNSMWASLDHGSDPLYRDPSTALLDRVVQRVARPLLLVGLWPALWKWPRPALHRTFLGHHPSVAGGPAASQPGAPSVAGHPARSTSRPTLKCTEVKPMTRKDSKSPDRALPPVGGWLGRMVGWVGGWAVRRSMRAWGFRAPL